jgi:hypothetical protein
MLSPSLLAESRLLINGIADYCVRREPPCDASPPAQSDEVGCRYRRGRWAPSHWNFPAVKRLWCVLYWN